MKNVNYYLLIATAIFILAGCASIEKQLAKKERDAEIFYRANPEKLAELCNDEFPLIPSEVIPGETKIIESEVEVPGPELPCPEPTEGQPNPSVKCPACKEIIRDFSRVDTLKVPDTRQIYLFQTELKKVNENNDILRNEQDKLKDELRKVKNQRNNYMWLAICLGVGILIFVLVKIFK